MPRVEAEEIGIDVGAGARAVIDVAVTERQRDRRQHRRAEDVAAPVADLPHQSEEHRGADTERGESVGVGRAHRAGGESDRGALHLVEVEVGADREAVGTADVAHGEAGRRTHRRRERGLAATRGAAAVPGRAHVHEVGVQRVQVVGGDAHAFGDAGAIALQDDVGAADQRFEHGAIGVVVEIEHHRLLAVQHLDAGHLRERHEVADRVAFGRLDLDDACALLRQQRGAERRGEERTELDDRHARERRLVTGGVTGCGASGDRRRGELDRGNVVGAERRRRRERELGPALRLRELGRHQVPVLVTDDAVIGDELRVGQGARSRPERVGPHVGFVVEHLEPLVGGARPHCGEQSLPELDPHGGIVREWRVAHRVVGRVERAGAQERLPQAVGGLGELEPLTVGRERDQEPEHEWRVGDERVGVERRCRLERPLVAVGEHEQEPVPRVVGEERMGERDRDRLARTAALAFHQRAEDPLQRVVRGADRAEGRAHEHRTGSWCQQSERRGTADGCHDHRLPALERGEG